MRKIGIIFFFGFIFSACCLQNDKQGPALLNQSSRTIASWKKLLGEPIQQAEFKLDGGLPEFRIELLNYIPKERYENTDFLVQELTWKKDSLTNLTIWFEKEDSTTVTYLHSLEWPDGAEF